MSWAGHYQYNIGKKKHYLSHSIALEEPMDFEENIPVLVCFSHLRWRFVYQRPQHLMSRAARTYRVIFVEEPIATERAMPWLELCDDKSGVEVLIPRLPDRYLADEEARNDAQRTLLSHSLRNLPLGRFIAWYYTPMSLPYSDHLEPSLTVYDCMDELSAFKQAPPELVERERRLIEKADLVFTGGLSLYDAKRQLHSRVYPMPSSVDIEHFSTAREPLPEPQDQAEIAHPRLGFHGVIDERLDLALLDEVARQRPNWQFVLVGPVAKIDEDSLPERANIHYLGGKPYDELPDYLAGWDVALMPFALNESTRFISPTKTPEYLAGGRPVVSTPITDVVRTYGDTGIVRIARNAPEFIAAIDAGLKDMQSKDSLQQAADSVLEGMSWDNTWELMEEKINAQFEELRYGRDSGLAANQ